MHARRNGNAIDVHRVLKVKSMRDFDDAFTAPLHGYRDAAEYYAQNSCLHYLAGIRVHTLVMRAMDDPFFANDIPHAVWRPTNTILPALTPYGGHVAFAEGSLSA